MPRGGEEEAVAGWSHNCFLFFLFFEGGLHICLFLGLVCGEDRRTKDEPKADKQQDKISAS